VKQKNMILMAVAVVCGLGAAVLTAKVSGGTKQAEPKKLVYFASKDLQPPTKFTKDSIKDMVKQKPMNASEVPETAIESEEELIEMNLIRSIQSGALLQKADISKTGDIPLPPDKNLMSLKLPIEFVTPFIKPTSRIDLMGTVLVDTGNNGKKIVSSSTIIPNMLVMAVDTDYIPNPGAAQGRQTVQVISLAVTTGEAQLIREAQEAGIRLNCIVRGDTHQEQKQIDWDLNKVRDWINKAIAGQAETTPPTETAKAPPITAPTTVKVPVALEDLPAGTELTEEILKTKFKMADWLVAPEAAVLDLNSQIGRFLQKELLKDQFITRSAIGAKKPMAAKAGEAEGSVTEKPVPMDEPKVESQKKPTIDRTISGASGTKVYRYELQDDGKYKLLGEVTVDGVVMPLTGGAMPGAAPEKKKPAEDDKGEGRIS
jgi:pilus assembly protein CpaB